MCCLNGGHVCGCTATGILFPNVQTVTIMTLTSFYISNKKVRRWQLRVASLQQNVTDIEIYYTDMLTCLFTVHIYVVLPEYVGAKKRSAKHLLEQNHFKMHCLAILSADTTNNRL